MDNVNPNIKRWNELFENYLNSIKKCEKDINYILDIKNNVDKLIGNQVKDDITFYKSIITNSYIYLMNSLKIRKMKFLKDLNYVWKQLNDSAKITEISVGLFDEIMKDYKKKADNILYASNNNTNLKWVKNDKIDTLNLFENNMNEILDYHLKLIDSFLLYTNLETQFYSKK
jgi:hypothetical protein